MKISTSFVAGAALALLPLTAALAQSAAEQSDQPSQHGATFESLDQDGDGRISRAEAAADANVTAQFSRYDRNADGYIERAEVDQANDPQPSNPEQ